MADNKTFADKRTALYWITPDKLQVRPGLNARDLTTPDNVEHIRGLADLIKANGFREDCPFELAQIDDEFFITSGHCRHAALKLAMSEGLEIEFVPYVPERRGTDDADRIIFQRVANSGKPLTPLEEGHNVKRLLGLGLDVATIAKRTGRSDTYIEHLLTLQEAPTDIKEMVAQRQVSAKLAVETMRNEGQTEGAAVLREAAASTAPGKKVKPKAVQALSQAKDERKRFRIAWKPKTQTLGVRIGNVEFAFSPQVWLEMGKEIVATSERFIADQNAEIEPIEHTPPPATVEGAAA